VPRKDWPLAGGSAPQQPRVRATADDHTCPPPTSPSPRSLGELRCVQNYVALSRIWARLQGDRGLPAQHISGAVDRSQATRTARLVRPGLAIGGLDAIEHESLDWAGHVRRGQHGTRAMCGCTAARRSDQLKICCADDSTIGNAVFLEAAVSTQAGRCAFALSAVRNIVLRAA